MRASLAGSTEPPRLAVDHIQDHFVAAVAELTGGVGLGQEVGGVQHRERRLDRLLLAINDLPLPVGACSMTTRASEAAMRSRAAICAGRKASKPAMPRAAGVRTGVAVLMPTYLGRLDVGRGGPPSPRVSSLASPALLRLLPPDDSLAPLDDVAERVGDGIDEPLFRWIADGLLTPYKKRGDRRTHIDLAEIPEAMRRAGRPGPKPRARDDTIR